VKKEREREREREGRKERKTEDGNAAWKALVSWNEGPVMSGEISKTLHMKLWNLR
jgi:hypothetical protein